MEYVIGALVVGAFIVLVVRTVRRQIKGKPGDIPRAPPTRPHDTPNNTEQ